MERCRRYELQGCSIGGFFFTEAIRTIHNYYDRLFNEGSWEDEEEEENKGGETEDERIKGPTSPLAVYGILPFVLRVSELTNHPYKDILGWAVMEVFYLTCYAIDKHNMEEMQIKMWQKTH